MIEETVKIGNGVDCCAQEALNMLYILTVRKMSKFKSKFHLRTKIRTVDAKSILVLMTVPLIRSDEVTIIADDPDEKEAVLQLKALLEADVDAMLLELNELQDESRQEKAKQEKAKKTSKKSAPQVDRLERLRKYTDDENILANVDRVAFDQDDLKKLLKDRHKEIYLCDNRFTIPLNKKDITYIGIGEVVAVTRKKEPVDFSSYGIELKNISFDKND